MKARPSPSLDKRMGALEASAGTSDLAELGKRVAALEAASAENAPKAAAAVQAAQQAAQGDQQLATQLKDLRADIDAARGEIPGSAARLVKLEAGAPKVGDADLAALAGRLDKIEAALAAPKSETRVTAEKPTPADNASGNRDRRRRDRGHACRGRAIRNRSRGASAPRRGYG